MQKGYQKKSAGGGNAAQQSARRKKEQDALLEEQLEAALDYMDTMGVGAKACFAKFSRHGKTNLTRGLIVGALKRRKQACIAVRADANAGNKLLTTLDELDLSSG